jgi:hypothetical protein
MRRLVFRIEQFEAPAKAKSSDWGYDRIAGALANLGYEISEWVMDGPKNRMCVLDHMLPNQKTLAGMPETVSSVPDDVKEIFERRVEA